MIKPEKVYIIDGTLPRIFVFKTKYKNNLTQFQPTSLLYTQSESTQGQNMLQVYAKHEHTLQVCLMAKHFTRVANKIADDISCVQELVK